MIYRLAFNGLSGRMGGLLSLGVYWSSFEAYKKDILNSQFHVIGHRHFQKSKVMARTMDSNTVEIQKMQTSLQKKRRVLNQLRQKKVLWDEKQFMESVECVQYFQAYLKLLQYMQLSNLKEEWHLRIAGWYNMQPFIRILIDRMIVEPGKREHLALLEAINWMQPHKLIMQGQNFAEQMKEQKSIDGYYRGLNLMIGLKTLKLVEGILEGVITIQKGKYYERFMGLQLKMLLRTTNMLNIEEVDNLLWLFEMYVHTFNDNPVYIQQFQQSVILSSKVKLQQKQIQTLLSIYNHLGRLNPEIYKRIIKPHLLLQSHDDILVTISILQFIINSQILDPQIISQCLKDVVSISKKTNIPDIFRLKIHFSIEYLRIKGVTFQFPLLLDKEYNDLCRRYRGNGSLARAMAIELDEKGRREGKEYYISNCLKKGRAKTQSMVEDKGQEIKNMPGYTRYKNVRFCCINLKQCVTEDATKQAVILEPKYHKFSSSGRMARFEEVKNEVLEYYGFKINYLESKMEKEEKIYAKFT